MRTLSGSTAPARAAAAASAAHRPRSRAALHPAASRRAPPRRGSAFVGVVRAAEQPGAGDLEFEGSILQDVRAGQAGFATRLKVEQGGAGSGSTASDEPGAAEGDVVTLSYDTVVDGADGGPTTALAPPDEPLTFEVGASGVMGNPLFQAFDRAVRGLRVGDSAVVKALGGEYDKELLFAVPRDHEEVLRLEAEAAASGGLKEGAVVQLANGQAAVLRRVADDGVLIDCNHPLAGAPLSFTLRVLALERGAGRGSGGLAAAVE